MHAVSRYSRVGKKDRWVGIGCLLVGLLVYDMHSASSELNRICINISLTPDHETVANSIAMYKNDELSGYLVASHL